MLEAKIELPDGREATLEVEEGVTQEQIELFAQEQYEAGAFDNPELQEEVAQPPAPKPQEEYSPAESAFIGAGQGATFGFGDEIISGLATPVAYGGIQLADMLGFDTGGQASKSIVDIYKQIQGESQAELNEAKRQNLISYVGGEVVGSIAGGIGAASTKAGKAAAKQLTKKVAGRNKRAAVVGGGAGALYGAGTSDIGEGLEGAGVGLVEGAIGGVVGQKVGDAAIKGVGKLKNYVINSDKKLSEVANKKLGDVTSDDVKKLSNEAYEVAAKEGGELNPNYVNKLINEVKEFDDIDKTATKLSGLERTSESLIKRFKSTLGATKNDSKLLQKAAGESEITDPDQLMEIANQYEQSLKNIKQFKPKRLLQYIKENGGVADYSGELKSLGVTNKTIPGLLRKEGTKGVSLDDVGEKLYEAGKFSERPTVNEVLDAIGEDTINKNVFMPSENIAAYDDAMTLIDNVERAGLDIDAIKKLKPTSQLTTEPQSLTLKTIAQYDSDLGDIIYSPKGWNADTRSLTSQGKKVLGIQRKIRESIENATPEDMVGGSAGFKAYKNARKLWSRAVKLGQIEKILNNAESAKDVGGNIKQSFRTFINNDKKLLGFTDKEKKIMKGIAETGKLTNLLMLFGNRMIGSGAGFMAGGPAGFGIGLAATSGSKKAAEILQKRQVDRLIREITKDVRKSSPTPTRPVSGLAIGQAPITSNSQQ